MATIFCNTKEILFVLNMERLLVPNAYCGTLRKFGHAIQNKPCRLKLEHSNVANSFTEKTLCTHSTTLILHYVTIPCLHIKKIAHITAV